MSNVIDVSAKIASDVQLGHFCVIGKNVSIGPGCKLGNHVVIHEDVVLESGVELHDHVVLGKRPMKARRSATTSDKPLAPLHLGANVTVGTHSILYRGCRVESGVFIADQVSIREDVVIGADTIVGRGVAIENRVNIGARCKIETNAYITAISEVGSDCFIAPAVAFSNDNYMGRDPERKKHFKGVVLKDGARIGVHATVLPGKVLHEDCMVAAGALVTHDVPAGKIALGHPAKALRDVSEKQLLKNQ